MGCLDDSTLGSWFDGDLSPEERAAAHEHLDVCGGCRLLVAELGRAFTRDAPPGADGPSLVVKVGERIDRYVVLEWLGAGGMGIVYGAYDPELDRRVAIKLLQPEQDEDDPEGAKARNRLLREAKTLARMSHPNIVTVYDAGTHERRVFVTMEYLRGGTLAQWIAKERPSCRSTVSRFLEAARGLAAAHDSDIVHGDFKPSNVLLGADGRARVADFGLARSPGHGHPSDGASGGSSWKGTPSYMSPEQRAAGGVDARSDQYSFCVALYEALYGELPATPPRFPARPGIPRRLAEVLGRGLSGSPVDRFPSMNALVQALSRDRRALWMGASVALATLAIVAMVGTMVYVRASGHGQVCEGADRKLSGVWDAPRKQAIATAFHATHVPYADDVLSEVNRQLDAYAQKWTRMHTAACEATRVYAEQSAELMDLRIACLDGEAREVAALTDLLARADAKTVEKAVPALTNLPNIDACANAAALRARVPTDPRVRAEVERLRGEASRAVALEKAGRYGEANTLVAPLVDPAKATGDRSLEAYVTSVAGRTRRRLGDYSGAETLLYEATDAAEAAKDDATKARALLDLSFMYANNESNFDQATHTAELAQAVLTRLPEEIEMLAKAEDDLASVDAERGRLAEGEARSDRALAMREKAFGADDYRLATSLINAAKNPFVMGNFDKALAYQRRALEISERALGSHHPTVALALMDLALTECQLRRLDEASRDARQALAMYEESLGTDHPELIRAEGILTMILREQGNLDEALAHGKRCLSLAEQFYPKDELVTISALTTLGTLEQDRGRTEEAILLHSRALAMAHRLSDPPFQTASVCINLAEAQLQAGRANVALPLAERSLALQVGSKGSDRAELAETWLTLARALWDSRGDRVRARTLAAQARDLYASLPGYEKEHAAAESWLTAHPGAGD